MTRTTLCAGISLGGINQFCQHRAAQFLVCKYTVFGNTRAEQSRKFSAACLYQRDCGGHIPVAGSFVI